MKLTLGAGSPKHSELWILRKNKERVGLKRGREPLITVRDSTFEKVESG